MKSEEKAEVSASSNESASTKASYASMDTEEKAGVSGSSKESARAGASSIRMSPKLRDQRDFSRIYRKGRATRSGTLLIRALPNHKPVTRVAVVVSKKVSKSAVRRNRLRRQITEAWREREGRIKVGFDVIITAAADQENSPSQVESALQAAGLVNQESKP